MKLPMIAPSEVAGIIEREGFLFSRTTTPIPVTRNKLISCIIRPEPLPAVKKR